MGRLSLWVLFGLTFLAVSLNDALVTAEIGPTESECRPYIEKAINELKTVDSDGDESDEDDDGVKGSIEKNDNNDDDDDDDGDDDDKNDITSKQTEESDENDDENVSATSQGTSSKEIDEDSGEKDNNDKDSKEETAEADNSIESGEKNDNDVHDSKENKSSEDDQQDSAEKSAEKNDDDDDSNENATKENDDDSKEDDSKDAATKEDDDTSKEDHDDGDDTKEDDEASKEDEDDDQNKSEIDTKDDDSKESESKTAENDDDDDDDDDHDDNKSEKDATDDDDDESGETSQTDQDDDGDNDNKSEIDTKEDDDDNSKENETDLNDKDDSKEDDDENDNDDNNKSDNDTKEDDNDTKEDDNDSKEDDNDTKEDDNDTKEDDNDTKEDDNDTKEDDSTEDKKDPDSKEDDGEDTEEESEKSSKDDDDDDSKENAAEETSVEDQIVRKKRSVDEHTPNKADDDDDDNDDSNVNDGDDDDDDSKEHPASSDDDKDSKEEAVDSAQDSGEDKDDSDDHDDSEETQPEDDLLLEEDIPENLRDRKHINELLHLDDEYEKSEHAQERVAEIILRDIKRVYDSAIKPLETLYKYRDLSNRHFGDPEIFSKPLVLFMGPWSGGKSSIINYLTDNEFKSNSLRSGAEPSPAYFNILMWGNETEVLDGTQLAADWTFSGLQKFGEGLEDRLRGLKMPSKLLEKVNIVEIPGILEVRKQVSRLFPFNDACQWFIDRADIIVLVYDPAKLDAGPETEAILDQLKGREYQTRILLNKADTIKPEELLRVQSALIWNISPLMSSAQPPVMYTTSLWSRPYDSNSPIRLLLAQEKAFLRDLRTAVDKRIENKIASARRFAVRVRNHAKMVDCYLNTYYNHKTIFGNKKRISEEIIQNPQNYHIYEGLSTLTNISRYDLPDPEVYRDFFRLNPLYEFKKLSETCTYFRGCPINKLDIAIAYDLPELVGKYKKMAEQALANLEQPTANTNKLNS